MVEHVATRKQNDRDESDGRPDVPVLDDGLYVVERGGDEGHDAGHCDGGDDDKHPVDGPLELGVWAVRCVT